MEYRRVFTMSEESTRRFVRCFLTFFLSWLNVKSSCVDNTAASQNNVYLDGQLYVETSAQSISDCATTCFLHTYCRSFGFESETRSCQLHFVDSSSRPLVAKSKWIHVDITVWQGAVLGPCAGHTCAQGEECHVNRVTKAPVCITVSAECPALPTLPNSQLAPGPRVDGSVRTYTCDANYYDVIHDISDASTTCLINGTWSTVSLECDGPFIQVETPSRDSYTFDLIPDATLARMTGGTSSLVFQVKACSDASFQFTTTGDVNGEYQTIIIVIGGWSNRRVAIKELNKNPIADYNSPVDILYCHKYLPFWIDWTGGIISIGAGTVVGNGQLVTWTFDGTFDLQTVETGTYYNIHVTRLFYER